MNGTEILATLRLQLADAVSTHNPPAAKPLAASPWVAMSLLQKSVRRGGEDLALRAAATLLQRSPERLWRRLGVGAFEDVGIADLEAVFLMTSALSGKKPTTGFGGQWPFASYLVSRLVHAPKCRAADDLLMTAESHRHFEKARLDLTYRLAPELVRIAVSSAPLPVRALALWYALGTDRRPSPNLRTRRGEPQAVFDQLCELGLPHTLVEIAREGFRKTGEVLGPFLILLCPLSKKDVPQIIRDDEFPPETMVGEVPSWAYDRYSREGRRALATFIGGQTETARWVREHLPSQKRVNFLGGILFAIEGGLLKNRLRWSVGDELRRKVDFECHGPHCSDATEILQLMRSDIDVLNGVRGDVC